MKKFLATKNMTNKNIYQMRFFKDLNGGTAKFKLKNSNLVFQTIWSDYMHTAIFDKSYTGNEFTYNIDFTNFEETSYQVFQDQSKFPDYNLDNNCIKCKRNDETVCLDKENESEFTIINRIPQEFNLDIITDKSIYIVNSGDSKLIADKFFHLNIVGKNKFECSLKFSGDTLGLVMHTNIFTFDSQHFVHKSQRVTINTKI